MTSSSVVSAIWSGSPPAARIASTKQSAMASSDAMRSVPRMVAGTQRGAMRMSGLLGMASAP